MSTVSDVSGVPKSKKYVIQVFNIDGSEVRTFGTYPLLRETIKRANEFGLIGTMLLLAENGCQICDDTSLQFYMENHHKFVLTNATDRRRTNIWQTLMRTCPYR